LAHTGSKRTAHFAAHIAIATGLSLVGSLERNSEMVDEPRLDFCSGLADWSIGLPLRHPRRQQSQKDVSDRQRVVLTSISCLYDLESRLGKRADS